ncbi:N-acetylmuramoyl-L-alanine amidase family protein [Fusibacter sp. 3D3]|uniref:peptidoglycan recognition protein family protein n=1 Tax=Fusibacter sp. 3D3 TaxID=1048380 RepID=UPI0008535517|nr:N-acetylmuramoyl-L-alanine amidase [Fusibacter sp. 3D3]GAU79494.1 N-acetylmuramoyl-L-alanine amidase [Fusibacter sp. 3D3]
MINKLNIIGGVIQNKEIGSTPLKTQIIMPSGNHNVRTQIALDPETALGITNHNTGNTSPSASANRHATWLQNVENADQTYVGAHFFVDETAIIQVLPINEVAYHAGDGKGDGNMKTIAIEICENGNMLKAEENAKCLNAALLLTYPHFKIYKHQDWSGKYCPRVILGRNSWNEFVEDILKYVQDSNTEASNAEVSPIEAWKIKGIHFAIEEGLITDYAYWLDRIDEEMPAWAHFIILEKALEKMRQEMMLLVDEKLEAYREEA